MLISSDCLGPKQKGGAIDCTDSLLCNVPSRGLYHTISSFLSSFDLRLRFKKFSDEWTFFFLDSHKLIFTDKIVAILPFIWKFLFLFIALFNPAVYLLISRFIYLPLLLLSPSFTFFYFFYTLLLFYVFYNDILFT